MLSGQLSQHVLVQSPHPLPVLPSTRTKPVRKWHHVHLGATELLICHARPHMTLACRAAAAAPVPASQQPADVDLRTASLLLLLAESFLRATKKLLTPTQDLLQVPASLEDLRCVVVIAEPDQAIHATSGNVPTAPHQRHTITYANAAARALLTDNSGGGGARGVVGRELGQVMAKPLPDEAMQYTALAPNEAPSWQWVRGCCFRTSTPPEHAGDSDARQLAVADCVVCDVASPTGRVLGKALLWDRWGFPASGCVGRPGVPALHPSKVPSAGDVEAALVSVRSQADAVKALKAQAGRGNKDREVQDAVAELQGLKQRAAQLQALRDAYAAPQAEGEREGASAVPQPYPVLAGLTAAGTPEGATA